MDTRIYPLDLPDVKAYLSLNPGDTTQDSFLTDCIESSCDQLAEWLPFSIIERDTSLTALLRWQLPGTAVTIQLTAPVLEIKAVIAKKSDGSMEVLSPAQWDLEGSTVCISPLPPATTRVTVEYRAGSDVPPAIRSALLMMVKCRFERREEDPMSDAVWALVNPFRRVNI